MTKYTSSLITLTLIPSLLLSSFCLSKNNESQSKSLPLQTQDIKTQKTITQILEDKIPKKKSDSIIESQASKKSNTTKDKMRELINQKIENTQTYSTLQITSLNQELFTANCLFLQLIGKLPWFQVINTYILNNLTTNDDKNKYEILKTSAKIWTAAKLTQLEQYSYNYAFTFNQKH